MTSHVIDLTKSGQFQIITDPASQGWLSHQLPDYLTFRINLPTFGSTFWINLSNQPSYWIGGAIGLWYVVFSDKHMYIGKCTSTYWGMYDSSSKPFCRSPTHWGVRYITLEYFLVALWMKALLNAARTSLLCGRQLCIQEHQGSDENDKSLLVDRPMAPRPSGEHIGLDLT